MRIGALHKTTLLDFPGKVSAIVFTRGCNFACPYCHNPDLLGHGDMLDEKTLLRFLARRKAVLQGVVISGGEPTLHDDLPAFCARLKALGYAVKLDTNGSRPEMVQALLAHNLVDYVAMDVKTAPGRYAELFGNAFEAVTRTLALLAAGDVPHEVRVPCAAPFITPETFADIVEQVAPDAPIFLQALRLEGVLQPAFFTTQGRALNMGEMTALSEQAAARGRICAIR